ncbi:MAG: pentapeptide repeat-containing protein [Chloroflexota bacterium]
MAVMAHQKKLEELHKALLDAYRTISSLRQMVQYGLDENLEEIVGSGTLSDIVFDLVQWADSCGKLDKLIQVAYRHNDGNPLLKAFVNEYGNHSKTVVEQELEHRRITVRLIIDGDFEDFSDADQEKLQTAINNLLRVKADTAIITKTESGSVIAHVELPENQLENLYSLFSEGKLSNLGVIEFDLSDADLIGANLRDVDLRGASLRKADLSNADLFLADLRDADLRDVDLVGADLRGADLRKTDLKGANLYLADLVGADLRGADLRDADLKGANLRDANLRGASLRKTDLRGASLRKADLSNADLFLADLYLADLRGADLRGADLRDADLRDTDLTIVQYDERTIWPDGFDLIKEIVPVRV